MMKTQHGKIMVHSVLVLTLLFAAISGCSKKYVRAEDDPSIDYRAMSLAFDRRDINHLYDQVHTELMNSSVVRQWEYEAENRKAPQVALFPIRNNTSEHISAQLDTLLSKFETDLVNETDAKVVSRERQQELISEIKKTQQSDAYNPNSLARYGKQLGAQYFLTGKIEDVAERVDDERRVQYNLFIQIIDVETGEIKFQKEATVTKALM